MSTPEKKTNGVQDKKEERKDAEVAVATTAAAAAAAPLPTNLKTTTETSTYFVLTKFNATDVSHEEKLPKNYNDFDNLLRKIILSLEETENVFLNQAKAILDRDLMLINLRFLLASLEKTLREKKQHFERIDQTIQCIVRLSSHIDNILCKLERELPGPSLIENAFRYSPARMTMYDMMMKISLQQRDMLQQLSTTFPPASEDIECTSSDPVVQFTRILSLHTAVLRRIETRTEVVEEQLEVTKALQKYYANIRKPVPCVCEF